MCTAADTSRALQPAAEAVAGVRIVGVHRYKHGAAWRRAAQLVSDLPLELYIAYTLSVGGTREQASSEWHGARAAHSAAGSS